MRSLAAQREFRGVTLGMYRSASRLVRGARYNEARRRDIWVVRHFFTPNCTWYRAVELACEIHDVDFQVTPTPRS